MEYLERNVLPDNVYVVVSVPPKYSIAQVVEVMKASTRRALREKFEFLRPRYWGRGGIWSVRYFLRTLGLDEETVRRYVRYQEEEGLGQAQLELK